MDLFKKILSYTLISLFGVVTISCEDDDFKNPNEFSDVFFENSLNKSFTDFGAETGEAITFLDLSQFALTHEWIIDEGTAFLGSFEEKDTLNLIPFIIPGSGKISTDEKVNVLFQTPGIKKIRLRNTFREEVTYIPPAERRNGGEDTLRSTLENGVWVFDHQFDVQVFEPVQAAFSVSKGDEVILQVNADDNPNDSDSSTWPEVVLESGDSLTFKNLTTIGDPNDRTWDLNGVSINEEEEGQDSLTVTYLSTGEFLAGMLTVNRFNPFAEGEDNKVIPLRIRVIPSSQPFSPFGTGELDDFSTIALQTTANLDILGSDLSNFTVQVTNTNQPSFSTQIEVSNLSVDPLRPSVLLLELSERIYQDDIIALSYVSDGGITSSEGKIFESFDNLEINTGSVAQENILDEKYYGFEGGLTQSENGWFIRKANEKEITIGSERVFSGQNSIKYSSSATITAIAIAGEVEESARISLEAGTYDFSIKVWLDPKEAPAGLSMLIQQPFANFFFDFQNQPRGEWLTLTVQLELKDTNPASTIVFQVAGDKFGGPGTFFVDDLSLREVELRP